MRTAKKQIFIDNQIEQAKKLRPRYLSMVIPARWYSGGRGLDSFRDAMLNDKHMKTIVDYTDSNDCQKVREGLEASGYEVAMSNVDLIASNYVDLDDNQMTSFNKLVAALEELDDVQNVYHNVNLPEEAEEE